MPIDFQFQNYIDRSKTNNPIESGNFGTEYAFSGDLKAMELLRKVKPVAIAVESTVKLGKELLKNDLLGSAVKVTPKQFSRIHQIVLQCAQTLQMSDPPVVYIHQNPYLNAATYGSPDDSFIVLDSGLIDHFTDEELAFIIGHECGHIHNGHVLFLTATHYLRHMASMVVRWVAAPALYSLNAWSRRAEITCDRAGLLTAKNVDVAIRCIIKLAVGSQRLYDEIDPEEYLKQLEEGQKGLGRFSELAHTHPYYPKRVKALRLFAKSRFYRETILKEAGGLDRAQIDAEVAEILSVT